MNKIDVRAHQEPLSPILLLTIVVVVSAALFWPREQPSPMPVGEDAVVIVDPSGLANSLLLDELCDRREVELRRLSSDASMENVEPSIADLFNLGSKNPPTIVSRINGKVLVHVMSDDPLSQLEGIFDGS